MIAMHMGALHGAEVFILSGLALGPFVILATVVAVVSRRDRAQAVRAERDAGEPSASTASKDTAAPQSVQT